MSILCFECLGETIKEDASFLFILHRIFLINYYQWYCGSYTMICRRRWKI